MAAQPHAETERASRIEAQLRAFYAVHNPGNDQNIAEIVHKFAGREAELCARLRKKYGVAPDLSGAANAPASTDAISTATATAAAAPALLSPVVASIDATVSSTLVYDSNFAPHAVPQSTGGALDFRARTFDPLRALQQRERLRHLAFAHPLDNIAKCRHLLPVTDPHHQSKVLQPSRKCAAPATSSTAAAIKQQPLHDATPTLFDRLADTYLDGPFSVLRRCFLERKRVVAVVRRVNSVRGTCSGYLKAFDKHMNLVLLDVTEVVVPLAAHNAQLRNVRASKLAATDAIFSVADPRRNRSILASQTQHHKQLFVRGDNVVMVHEDRLATRRLNER